MPESVFSKLSDDLILIILHNLEDDPRSWAIIASVSTRLSFLVRNFCYRRKCLNSIPAVVADILPSADSNIWPSLHKISVCCPGLLHSGVLLENSDFGLERELGPDEKYRKPRSIRVNDSLTLASCSTSNEIWSLYDDLFFDTLYSEPQSLQNEQSHQILNSTEEIEEDSTVDDERNKSCKSFNSFKSHLACGSWNLSLEEGNKLLGSRFNGDSLYICDFPGCVHVEEKRNYMLFRGMFKNFKETNVWRTIDAGKRSRIDLSCGFCSLKETWDLHACFCLRKWFGFHDDGEPVVRAYVCENGHVSGAWTDLPLDT